MNQISYTRRICNDKDKIEAFLQEARVGIVGLNSEEYPYAVPVNFVWKDGAVYFHGMGSGKKVELLSKTPPVCFTVYQEIGTVTDPVPCHADTAYMSVMIFGTAERVADFSEAAQALTKLMEKYMPGFYANPLSERLIEKYRSSMDGNGVAVYKITPKELTAKENSAEPEQLFHPNR